jgi:hypothetical protein
MATSNENLPLISYRSPSYERARRELAHPSPTTDPRIIALLAFLVEAEDNARVAYAKAATLVSDEDFYEQLESAAGTHEERENDIGRLITELGGSPPRPGECRRVLEVEEADLAEAARELDPDHAVLGVLRELREKLSSLYQRTAADPLLSPAQQSAVKHLAP